jgi:hypothetical protein
MCLGAWPKKVLKKYFCEQKQVVKEKISNYQYRLLLNPVSGNCGQTQVDYSLQKWADLFDSHSGPKYNPETASSWAHVEGKY